MLTDITYTVSVYGFYINQCFGYGESGIRGRKVSCHFYCFGWKYWPCQCLYVHFSAVPV